jgi:GNAT superfamily N-acetyltransferase
MVRILRTTTNHPDFESLIRLLDADLWSRNCEGQEAYSAHNNVAFIQTAVVAYLDDQPAGCGCFKPFDNGSVEIKRMYVCPAFRGQGISKLVLAELEQWAAELGNKIAVLETGLRQPEAIGLYSGFGYQVIENYGPYKDLPNSVCFQKELSR